MDQRLGNLIEVCSISLICSIYNVKTLKYLENTNMMKKLEQTKVHLEIR